MRTSLAILASTLLASSAFGQTPTAELVFYQGDSVLNDWGIWRHADLDGDGLFLDPTEMFTFGDDAQVQINYVQDLRYRNEGGTDFMYAIATNDMVLKMQDLDGDGSVDGPGEIVEWADTRAGGGFSNTSPDAMDYDPITGTMYVTDDNYNSGPQPGSGIHAYTDLNTDGNANGAGEFMQFVDANLPISVAGTAGSVTIDAGDFEGLMFDSTNGVVISFAQQDVMLYAFQDLNADGDANDAGEAWNFLNLVGDVAGLELNADVQAGILQNPSCPSSSGIGLFGALEVLDFAPGAGPLGEDVYWIMSTAANASCTGAGGLLYRGIDFNGDLDLNDAGEVTLFMDGPGGPLGIPGMYGGANHDNGYSVRATGGVVYYLYDLNGDGDADDAGEQIQTGIDPLGHFVGEMEAIPAGSFPLPATGFFNTFGTGGTSSGGLVPSIGNVGFPAVGQDFDINVTNAIPFLPTTLFLGFSDTVWVRPPSIVLPFDMTGIGAPGNTLYVAGDFQFTVSADAAGFSSFTLTVPTNPALVGRDLYAQWYCTDVVANPRGVTMSNAAHTQVFQ